MPGSDKLSGTPCKASPFAAPRRGRPRQWRFVVFAAVLALTATAAEAGAGEGGVKAEEELKRLEQHEAEPSLYERQHMTGGWGGVRDELTAGGLNLGFEYLGEFFSNVSGGIRTGTVYQGRFEMAAELDLEKLVGWEGGTIFANAYQIHGRGLSPDFLGNLLPASNVEAHAATRLFDLWFQQDFLDGRAGVRFGQLAADDEFVISDAAGNFLNGSFGWLALAANNLPSGGPANPLAAPGVRIEAMPAEDVTLRTAVFSGDPAGRPGDADPQLFNASGTTFSFAGGVFWISELQLDASLGAAGPPGSYKFGGWYHSGGFDDLRHDTLGMSLAAPTSSGVPARHRGNHALYAAADQTVWRETDGEGQGLTLFARIGGAPSNINPVDSYVDGGATYQGLIPGRNEDMAGIAVGYAHVSGDLQGLARDAALFGGPGPPVPDYEAVIEILYSAHITPWWLVQPDLQYLFHPGGNTAHPGDSTGVTVVPDAVVLGIRSTFTF